MAIRKFIWVILIGLTACTPLEIADPPAPPEIITITLAPILRSYLPQLHQCAAEHPQAVLIIEERPASITDFRAGDFVLALESLTLEVNNYMVLLGMEEIVFIAGSAVPQANLDAAGLAASFSATEPKFELWAYPEGNELRQILEHALLEGDSLSPFALIAPNPEAMFSTIQETPQAVGYLPKSWLGKSSPANEIIPLEEPRIKVPILALSEREPEGTTRSILACLQKEIGQ